MIISGVGSLSCVGIPEVIMHAAKRPDSSPMKIRTCCERIDFAITACLDGFFDVRMVDRICFDYIRVDANIRAD